MTTQSEQSRIKTEEEEYQEEYERVLKESLEPSCQPACVGDVVIYSIWVGISLFSVVLHLPWLYLVPAFISLFLALSIAAAVSASKSPPNKKNLNFLTIYGTIRQALGVIFCGGGIGCLLVSLFYVVKDWQWMHS